jgi:general secretion pathway protein A
VSRRARGESTVLIVDEAQSLPSDLLEEIRLLANIETNEEKLLSVVLAGQPELAERLQSPSLRQLKQRVALRCELLPLTFSETTAYVAGRISAAGGTAGRVFTHEAVAMMHERSKGVPRTINVIADNALLGGFALGERPVGRERVREVCRDFKIDFDDSHDPDENSTRARGTEARVDGQPNGGRLLAIETSVDSVPSTANDSPAGEQVAASGRKMSGTVADRRSLFSFFGR